MIIRSSGLFGLDHHTMVYLIIAIALTLVPASNSAPMYESDQTELENYGESTGCYYNYNHYGEGDRIMTNEPCLNCTCHDRMLMCYLRVCPFTKAIGQDCTIEKREDQCCPVITCPEVEVQLLDHQTTANPALGATSSSEVGAPDQYGCSINGRFYPEGAQVPSNPQKPCELCYCIRNMTTCVMQECTLHIDGCQPIYNKGVCCPVKYDCDHDKDSTPMLDDESTTTVRPTPGFILTTTVSPSVSTDCVHNGETYADGALIMTDKPCEHCYCMRGDIVCAVQECGTPLENEGKNCTALPPAVGQCCPDKYICDGSAAAMLTTTVPSIPTPADDDADDAQEKDEDQQQYDDKKSTKSEQESVPTQTTQATQESSTTMAPMGQKVPDVVPADDDEDDEQQQQEHVAPQFEDVQTDDSHEEDDEQVPEKVDDEQRVATTAQPSDSEELDIASDHIPGHEVPHKKEETTTVDATFDAAAVTTTRPDALSHVTEAVQDETSTETHDDAEVPSDISGTTIAPTKIAPEAPEADQVSAEEDDEEATSTPKPALDVIAASNEPTTARNDEDITESVMTTPVPPQFVPLADADEKENEIHEHHDEATETNVVQHQPEHDDAVSSDEREEQKEDDSQEKQEETEEFSTTTTRPERDELSTEPETHAHVPSSEAVKPEQDKPEVSTEKKEAAQKADDQPEQDFVELPPAVVVTELPPIPTTSDEPLAIEQTPEPPKDEILPNMPLEADSHVLSDSMTTEHAPTFGDRKEDDAQEQEQTHIQPGADMEEPVEMNTIIPLEQDEQKVGQPTNEENELGYDKEQDHEVEHDQHSEEDDQSGEEQEHVTPAQAEVQTHATPVEDKPEEDQHVISPDKLFPESIPGEGDCLIDGVTYENGASVPPSGKCQVACHCSNSIVHCEMVRCKAAPRDDCTPKSTLSGECCPTYVCPKETTSTASSVSVESTEASTESDAESDEEQLSADVSAESSESSTKAPVSDSQFTSTDEEDDESSQPSEAESDSAGFDLDDEVFKPLRPNEPFLNMNINYFAGNRPTTANYDDNIILSTAAPTNLPPLVDTVSETVTKHSTGLHKQGQHIPTDTTPSADVSTTEQKEESTTLGDFAERGPEAEQDEQEVTHVQDEETHSTTTKTLTVESETTAVPIKEKVESSSVQHEVVQVEVTTSGVVMDNEQGITTSPAADEAEDDSNQQHEIHADDEQESVREPEHDSTTTHPAIAGEVDRDDEQERPMQTTIRPVEPAVEDATEHKPTEQYINDIESDDSSSTVEDDDKPSAVADGEDIRAPEATTTRASDIDTERETMTETQLKAVESTSVPTISTDREEDLVQQATTTPTAALDNELESGESASEEQKDEIENVEPTAPSTSKSVIDVEQTTPSVQEAGPKLTTIADEEQTSTTAPALVTEKESDVPVSVTVQKATDEDREDIRKTTEATVTQKTTVQSASDDSLIFRVDDDEDEPIVKPTLDEKIPPQGAVKPTIDDIKPTQDAVKPQTADREETDDDNLISPEQDGGFNFPQDDDDEPEEPIFKPSLDDSEQHVAMPLPVEIPQETVPLEPVDQIKEHDDIGQSTTMHSDHVTVTPTTVAPLKPEQDREQITHDDSEESNEIVADVHQIATPIKKPDETPVYDDIEENEQQTVAPTKHTPELTTVGHKQDTKPQSTTEKSYVTTNAPEKTDDEQEQPTTTTRPSEAFDAKPAIEPEQDEKEDDDTVDTLPDLETVHPTTTRAVAADSAQDEEQKVTTVSPIAAHDEHEQDKPDEQDQDKQTTPRIPTHDEEQSEEEEDNEQIHLDDKEEDVPAATTPRVSQDLDSQNEGETEKDQVSQSDDQVESDEDDATTKATVSYDEVQTTTATVDVKPTQKVITEQSTTLAPLQDVVKEDEKTEKPDFGAIENDDADTSDEDEDEQKETVTKVPVVQTAADTSEELSTSAESVTKEDDDSSSVTEATQKDSEEDQKVDDDQQDDLTQTTLAPHTIQDKKQQPEPESDVTAKPAPGSEQPAPLEDDVDFEQEQQTVASPTTAQATEEKDKQTTTSLPLDEDKLPESLSTEAEKMGVSTEQEVQVTTVRATEFDFNAVDKHQEHPLAEPEFDDDDDRDAVAHSTTFATPEQPNATYDAPDKKPAETESDESVSTDETSNAPFDESGRPEADSQDENVPSVVSVTARGPVDDDDSQEEDDDGPITTVTPKPVREEESSTSTTVAAPQEPEHDETSEGYRPIDKQEPEQTSETVGASVPESDDKVQSPAATTIKPADPVEAATTSEEEQDEVEQPQTDDLNADDDSSEEEDTPVTLTTTVTPVKAATTSDVTSTSPKDKTSEEVTPKAEVYTTLAPMSDSQVTEQQTTVRQEDEPVSTAAPVSTVVPVSTVAPVSSAAPVPYSNTTAITQPAEDASQPTSTTVLNQDEEKEHTLAPEVSQDEVTEVTSASPAITTSQPSDSKAEEPVREVSTSTPAQDDISQSTVAPVFGQDDKLDDRLDEKVDEKPVAPVQDEELPQKPQQPAADDSDEQQAAVKPTFSDDEEDDQQKVQEPEFTGLPDDSSAPAKPTQQPETVGPSYGAPGQHYDTGYGHMPPHYPPSSYEDDYGEEEDPAAFGPGTCRYGGKLYVSAQQIPRDDPCDFCFCFRSDIICLQQSCPPPISGCNEEPIAGFCCPRYECPVSMATVLNVTTSTTTTTTTLPPHFLSHAYKGHVQKRGCQIQGKPYNVGETVASASGPCMRCTCGGDGQMQCEPKACSPEPMLQQMIAVAAARRR
ncbi:mucin-17 [Anopheles funestus]|uniref:mucin-17 n=1 Tax=Anopheles funestus TaxID=62324 RepID=UPI0020C5D18E|nr:mucin-17 [Anopheles funestus]XP_049299762.1 mucin-17 [Anopheles funestus]